MVMRVSMSHMGSGFMLANPGLYSWDDPPERVDPDELEAAIEAKREKGRRKRAREKANGSYARRNARRRKKR